MAAKVEILRYADMFQGIRKQTMVEAQDTVARIVTQTDIFDELRHRRSVLEGRTAALLTEYDELLAIQSEIQFGGQRQLVNTYSKIDKLKKELAEMRTQQAVNEAKLKDIGDVKIQASVITSVCKAYEVSQLGGRGRGKTFLPENMCMKN